jgi:23S rRNA maturation-related 3'-5' exoribonuclease YhaM
MALAVADAFERHHRVKVNRDYLIAGAILQDASKVVEFERGADGTAVPTEIGRNYPHAFWAAHVALRHEIPDEIVHVLLTHTPQASKFPTTLEGKILYYVDQIDVIGIHKDRWRKELFITK